MIYVLKQDFRFFADQNFTKFFGSIRFGLVTLYINPFVDVFRGQGKSALETIGLSKLAILFIPLFYKTNTTASIVTMAPYKWPSRYFSFDFKIHPEVRKLLPKATRPF